MRYFSLLLLTVLCTCGPALNLSAQCEIDVEIVDTPCSDAGGPSFFINFRVRGSGDSIWTSPTLNVSGLYNTGTLYSAGPFPGEVLENVLFQDSDDGACFTVLERVEANCSSDCANFSAEARREPVTFCETGEIWTLRPVGGTYPILLQLVTPLGDTISSILNGDTTELTQFYDEGEYTVLMTDANDCSSFTEFSARANPCHSISGRSWLDENGNGIREANETVAVDALVTLIDLNNSSRVTQTNDAGVYSFNGLVEGEYRLVIESTQGLSLTVQGAGDDPTVDNDFRRDNNSTFWIGLGGGQSVENLEDLDAGWLAQDACDSLLIDVTGEELACGVPHVLVVEVISDAYPVTIQLNETLSGTHLDSVEVSGPGPHRFDNIIPGRINVSATDSAGCSTSRFIAVPESGELNIIIRQEGSLCLDGAEATLTAEVFGSDGETLDYLWSTGEMTATIGNLENGRTYSVLVSDPVNGCEATAFIQAFSQGNDSLFFYSGSFFIPCTEDSVLVIPDTILDNFTYQWFGPQNNIIDGPSFFATQPGFYRLRATNDIGCAITGWATVSSGDLNDQFIEVFAFGQDSVCNDQTCFALETTLGQDPNLGISLTWETPDQELTNDLNQNPFGFFCTSVPGLYQLTVANECDTIVRSLFVNDFLGCSSISGQLWLDADADCALDAGERPVPNYVVMLTGTDGGVYYALTDAQGNWSAELPLGTYVIEPTLDAGSPFGACSPPPSVTLGNSPLTGVQLFLPVLDDCPRLTTDVSMPFLRRCFSSSAWVSYENAGAVTAENAELTVTLDDFFTNITADADFAQNGNTLTFQLGDLPPFASGAIFFSFVISCEANLGQSHCIEASITPDEPCGETANWNGALVNVEALGCDGDSVIFRVTNIGETQMSIPLSYIIVEDGIMLNPTPFVNGLLEANEEMQIAVSASGSTVHLITNQEPHAPADSLPTAMIEGCRIVGDESFSTGFANILPLSSGALTTSVVCRENVGAYDPNDKNGYPLGFDGQNIFPGTRLNYAIRFQNTGTDTAFTVVIRDTIAPALDLSTIKFESASHDYTVTLDTHRVLTFVFENIMLPDSNVNLAASQGVVNFSIDHDPSLVAGDQILNEAAIYFDFNEPVITNVSRHVISKDGLPVSLRAELARSVELSLFPNPTDGQVRIRLPESHARPDAQLTVTDIHGRELTRTNYARAANGWNLDHLPAGYYFVLLLDDSGRAAGRAGFVKR